jgi:hypothetical protein
VDDKITRPVPLVNLWYDTGETPTVRIPRKDFDLERRNCCAQERAPGHRYCRICGAALWLK